MSKSVTIRVPATTSNLGPGFDCLGIAFRIYNFIHVIKGEEGKSNAMAKEASKLFFKKAKTKPFKFSWCITGDVPQSRGLGSSVTLRLGILHGLNALSGHPLDADTLYRLCAGLEGHPDNAAPAAYGGFTVSRSDFTCLRSAVSEKLSFVLLIPSFEISTPAARKVLPKQIAFKDAVSNVGNSSLISAAFLGKRYELLHGCFADHLHQPYRKKLLPALDQIISAGVRSGALGGWLSGSGSTVACLTLENPVKIGRAMLRASRFENARIVIAKVDNAGVKITTKE